MNKTGSERESLLRRRIRWLTWFFIFGLFLSGATAIPLRAEVHWLVNASGASNSSSDMAHWLLRVRNALDDTESRQPFLFYGTDWLAFGHFVIAIVFIGALRDPVRNRWLFDFGLIACVLVIPFALGFGGWRGIPWWWRAIDCSFGIFGFFPPVVLPPMDVGTGKIEVALKARQILPPGASLRQNARWTGH